MSEVHTSNQQTPSRMLTVLSSSLAHANLGICMRRAIPSPVLKTGNSPATHAVKPLWLLLSLAPRRAATTQSTSAAGGHRQPPPTPSRHPAPPPCDELCVAPMQAGSLLALHGASTRMRLPTRLVSPSLLWARGIGGLLLEEALEAADALRAQDREDDICEVKDQEQCGRGVADLLVATQLR